MTIRIAVFRNILYDASRRLHIQKGHLTPRIPFKFNSLLRMDSLTDPLQITHAVLFCSLAEIAYRLFHHEWIILHDKEQNLGKCFTELHLIIRKRFLGILFLCIGQIQKIKKLLCQIQKIGVSKKA